PESPEIIRQELNLQLTLGLSLATTRGWATPEVAQAYRRAQELCRQAGESPESYSALYGLSIYYLLRAELSKARELSEELLRLAGKDQDSSRTIVAHYMLGFSLLFMGDLAPAEEHFTQGLELYRPGQSIQRYTFLTDPVYSASIIRSFIEIGGQRADGISKKVGLLLKSEDSDVRRSAALALGEIGGEGAVAA